MKNYFVILFAITISLSLYAQDDWELKKEKDGIKVYTREKEGSTIKEYKAITIMETKLSSIVAVMKDLDNYPKFFKNLVEVRLIESNDTSQTHYIINNTPWPVTDRDGAFHSVFSQYYDTKIVKMTVELVKDYPIENKKCVRMEEARGFWLFAPLDSDKVEITYQMYIDPGGGIPAWILNTFIVDAPIDDLTAIRERVKMEQYENVKFDFLVDY